jgi:hypothetical protein
MTTCAFWRAKYSYSRAYFDRIDIVEVFFVEYYPEKQVLLALL